MAFTGPQPEQVLQGTTGRARLRSAVPRRLVPQLTADLPPTKAIPKMPCQVVAPDHPGNEQILNTTTTVRPVWTPAVVRVWALSLRVPPPPRVREQADGCARGAPAGGWQSLGRGRSRLSTSGRRRRPGGSSLVTTTDQLIDFGEADHALATSPQRRGAWPDLHQSRVHGTRGGLSTPPTLRPRA
jgi:hypothetical protein